MDAALASYVEIVISLGNGCDLICFRVTVTLPGLGGVTFCTRMRIGHRRLTAASQQGRALAGQNNPVARTAIRSSLRIIQLLYV